MSLRIQYLNGKIGVLTYVFPWEQFIAALHIPGVHNVLRGYGIENNFYPCWKWNRFYLAVSSQITNEFPGLKFSTILTFIYILFNEANTAEIVFVLTSWMCTKHVDVLRHDWGPIARYSGGSNF